MVPVGGEFSLLSGAMADGGGREVFRYKFRQHNASGGFFIPHAREAAPHAITATPPPALPF